MVLVLAVVMALMTLGLPLASAQDHDVQANDVAQQTTKAVALLTDPGQYADHDLVDALAAADLLDSWLSVGFVSPQVAVLEVAGGSAHDQARSDLMQGLALFGERGKIAERRIRRIERSAERLEMFEEIARDLEQKLRVASRPQSVPRPTELSIRTSAMQARAQLALFAPVMSTGTFTLERVDVVEGRVQRLRTELLAQVTLLARSSINDSDVLSSIDRFARLATETGLTAKLLASVAADDVAAQAQIDAARELLVAQMQRLHDLRALSTTAVGSLPVVTVDAYVRGAEQSPAGCTVEWPLLAGIGRIESRHGTMNSTTVQASGKLTQPIFGPLLDGGATQAEAEEARRQAEDEAAAAIVAAEEEAIRIEREQEEYFNNLVWGDEPRPVVEATPEPTPTPEPEPGRFDPDLWGDAADAANAEEARDNDEAGDGEDEEEDAVLLGNGFAVIVDTDGGSLDGNARWDRAVGPMQFIPETWSYWQTDGNGDGWADPQNLYDAAASAARFLCGLQERRGASPYIFVLGYNSSDTYVRNVMDVANEFAETPLPEVLD